MLPIQSVHQQNVCNDAVNVDSYVSKLAQMQRETERVVIRNPPTSNQPLTATEHCVPTYRAILACHGILPRQKLGSGSYSKVRMAYRIRGNGSAKLVHIGGDADMAVSLEKVAVKIIDRRKAPEDYQTRFMPREMEIWPSLDHPNIVRLHQIFMDPFHRYVFMVSEFAEGGDCLRYVQRMPRLSFNVSSNWIAQLCCGVQYMHSQGVCHRDLKLENLFLDRTCTTIKIGDLGFTRRFKDSTVELSKTYCGSKSYAAPEILMGMPHDAKKSDVWAIGVIAYILLTGKMPFDEKQPNSRIIHDQRRLAALQWDRFPSIPSTFRDFIAKALTFHYLRRPTIPTLLRHEWFLPHRNMIDELLSITTTQPRVNRSHHLQLDEAKAAIIKQPLPTTANVAPPLNWPNPNTNVFMNMLSPNQAVANFGKQMSSTSSSNNLSDPMLANSPAVPVNSAEYRYPSISQHPQLIAMNEQGFDQIFAFANQANLRTIQDSGGTNLKLSPINCYCGQHLVSK